MGPSSEVWGGTRGVPQTEKTRTVQELPVDARRIGSISVRRADSGHAGDENSLVRAIRPANSIKQHPGVYKAI